MSNVATAQSTIASINNKRNKMQITIPVGQVKRIAGLTFLFAPIVAAVYMCKGTAKAARAIEQGAKKTAEKLEAADKSLSVKAEKVKQDCDDILGIE
jgi:high-affinity K+ transport system ATPase subunit B